MDLGVRRMRLLTNNPKKIVGLEGFELKVVDRVPIEMSPNRNNFNYLKTKKTKMGHLLKLIRPPSLTLPLKGGGVGGGGNLH